MDERRYIDGVWLRLRRDRIVTPVNARVHNRARRRLRMQRARRKR